LIINSITFVGIGSNIFGAIDGDRLETLMESPKLQKNYTLLFCLSDLNFNGAI